MPRDDRFELFMAKIAHERDLAEERDRRYEERDLAFKAAVDKAFASAERANALVDATAKEYRQASNEWRGTLNDVIGKMMTRAEVEHRFGALEERLTMQFRALEASISDLRESRSKSLGRDEMLAAVKASQRWMVGTSLGVLGLLLTLLYHLLSG